MTRRVDPEVCGIAGNLDWGRGPDAEAVQLMCDGMYHRGPDAGHIVQLGPLVLGHRRLSIIDTSEQNDQPQFDSSRRLCVVFNGEIYNFRELRSELEAKGSQFRTQGDTEVLLEAYRHWGIDCLQRLNGMFAFAIWDAGEKRLFLARDRAGEKPLFYFATPTGLVFASEPRALRRHPLVSACIDPIGLAHYLALNYTVGERSLIEGVRRLPPAHYMVLQEGERPVIARYWNLASSFLHKRTFASEGEASEALLALIDDAVRLRMISDVPLGAFLSGGVDSSTIVAAMNRQQSAGVKTFTAGFGDAAFDEVDEARATARYLKTDHHEARLTPNATDWIKSVIAAADEPLADTSALPTWFLAQFARQQVTVVLSGDGGDECFAGYETYVADRLHGLGSRLPSRAIDFMQGLAARFVRATHRKVSFDYKLRQFLAGLKLSPARAHYSWRLIFDNEALVDLAHPDWLPLLQSAASDAYGTFEQHLSEVQGAHPIDQGMYVDIKTWLPDDILVKVDRATMAHSLEARAPFLDHRIMEFAASLPIQWKLKGLKKKYLLKKSQAERLPDWLLKRRKQGFNAPISRWLAGPMLDLARDVLFDSVMQGWFRRSAIERLLQDHLAMRADNGFRLFGLVCFGIWAETL